MVGRAQVTARKPKLAMRVLLRTILRLVIELLECDELEKNRWVAWIVTIEIDDVWYVVCKYRTNRWLVLVSRCSETYRI